MPSNVNQHDPTTPVCADRARNPAYRFGDSDLAAERLRRLAEVFEPSTREFLETLSLSAGARVADLGCGPGHTTRLLAEVFPGASVAGLDSSESFVALAARTPHPRVACHVADVTRQLPGGPYDLIYSRYLLTHVPRWIDAIHLWSRHLAPGGIIAIEENEWIQTSEPAFERYLAIVSAMLADGGQELYVGARLEGVEDWSPLVKASSEVCPISVSSRAAAAMFLPNLQTWRHQEFIQNNFAATEIETLGRDLQSLLAAADHSSAITFARRRLVLAKKT